MILSLRYFVNMLISNGKETNRIPRLNLSRLSRHDLQDINLPPHHAERTRLSHELDDWRARFVR